MVEVLAAEVRDRFGHSVEDLRALVNSAPDRVRGASEVLRWFDQLTEAQQFLEEAEEALVDALVANGTDALTEDQMDLARTVDAAVTLRDGRALVVRYLLDPDAPGKRTGAARGEALGVRRSAALSTSVPPRPAAPAPASAGVRR
ncbi:hypothetical protein VSR01_28215 [Actinacidiphila sp. DG2A-62]|uniref:hypothetical protein n=1 Tax=Actinacidiphila sp. DG2A-62 TaxID=3108821 RepID=UPI002DBE9A4D|nr:hypothetical protein [Actinacidiphila sp. DG2A-62]MEC3997177.1 hypothetical protein [Actinacidiphila sp. DG2A-62]